jgi:hypothetical protein
MRTPVSELGLTPAEARRLTPGARKLSRGDLVAMLEGKVPPAAQALTLRDLGSIRQVFAATLRGRLAPDPGCCCCCGDACCCCCVETLAVEPG